MAEKKYNYRSESDYLNFIKDFPSASFPSAGFFYVQTYMFTENPKFKDLPKDKKKFYDFAPVNICLSVNPEEGTFTCLNWHFLTVEARKLLLGKFLKVYPKLEDKPRAKIPSMNYEALKSFLKKAARLGVRKYRFERVIDLRVVPGDKVEELMNFIANFYYASSYNQAANRYRKG